MNQNSDLESHGRHKSKFCQQVQDSGENFPKLIATSRNQNNHRRENLVDFEQSDDDGYDTYSSSKHICKQDKNLRNFHIYRCYFRDMRF